MQNPNGITAIPNAVTRTILCVNEIGEADFAGILYNPYLPGPVEFGQVKDIVNTLEQFFNDISYPQSYFEDRTFLEDKAAAKKQAVTLERVMDDARINSLRGAVATFRVEVRYRQSATWQGTITWIEREQSASFKSTLEFLKLLDSALTKDVLRLET